MIEQKLKTYFGKYNNLSPRAEFLSHSKRVIFATQQQLPAASWRSRIFESVTASGALVLASLLIVFVFGGISYLNHDTGSVATSANSPEAQAMLKEASSLVASVQIKEIERFTESAEQVVTALDTLANDTQSN
jgi:hypothetical protein